MRELLLDIEKSLIKNSAFIWLGASTGALVPDISSILAIIVPTVILLNLTYRVK